MCMVHQHEVRRTVAKPRVWWQEALLVLLGIAMLAGIVALGAYQANHQPEAGIVHESK